MVDVVSSGVELAAEEGTTFTVDKSSSAVELGTGEGCTSGVDVRSTGDKLCADNGLEETASEVVTTALLDEAGAEGTTGIFSGVSVEDEVEDSEAGGASGVPVPSGGWIFSGVCVTVIDSGSRDELDESCSL